VAFARPPELTPRQAAVLALLTAGRQGWILLDGGKYLCPDGWVDGWYFVHPLSGGMEGLRRLRELRAMGYKIESRPKAGSPAWQYRGAW